MKIQSNPKSVIIRNNQTRKPLGWMVIYPLFLAPVLFLLIWIMLGKPAYPWDAAWYRDIIDNGYSFNGDITRQQNVAFLPGYPVVMKMAAMLFGINSVLAQQVVCLLGYLVGSWFFFKVFSLRIGEYKAAAVVMIWSLMPFSIYFMNGYSESILLALVGAFFYFLERGRVISASMVISYGLITRPHAMAMLPVFFYFLYRVEHCKGVFSWYRSLGLAGVKSVELAPVIILFPVIMTSYWYFSFEDSLIYKNSLYAWGGTCRPTIAQDFSIIMDAITSIFKGSAYTDCLTYKCNCITLSPLQMAAFVLVSGSLLTPVFLTLKCFDFFIFNVSIVIIGIVTAGIDNEGRHISLVFSIPFVWAIGLDVLQSRFRKIVKDNPKKFFSLLALVFICFLNLVLFCLLGSHFVCYIKRFLNGVWVS